MSTQETTEGGGIERYNDIMQREWFSSDFYGDAVVQDERGVTIAQPNRSFPPEIQRAICSAIRDGRDAAAERDAAIALLREAHQILEQLQRGKLMMFSNLSRHYYAMPDAMLIRVEDIRPAIAAIISTHQIPAHDGGGGKG